MGIPKYSEEAGVIADTYYEISGKNCKITLELLERNSSKGRWLARVSGREQEIPKMWGAEYGWPRYYFDLSSAKNECIAWLKANDLFQRTSHWKDTEF